MHALIDGIHHLRAQAANPTPEQVNSGALMREVIELLAHSANSDTIPERSPVIEAERVLLEQVFMNLIGNAIKFTREHVPIR
jgi:signal transduction histidine kinase